MKFSLAILKSQRDLTEKLKRKRQQRMKKLEMEQAAEREEFERKVSKIILSQTVPHVPCDVFLMFFSSIRRSISINRTEK